MFSVLCPPSADRPPLLLHTRYKHSPASVLASPLSCSCALAAAASVLVHSGGKAIVKDVDFVKIARRTPGFTGAYVKNLMNEYAIVAARGDLKEISPMLPVSR